MRPALTDQRRGESKGSRSEKLNPPRHSGFEDYVVKSKVKLPTGQFIHYLHHRYFECNYGSQMVPFDKWFGTLHDGTAEAHARMLERWGKSRTEMVAKRTAENG